MTPKTSPEQGQDGAQATQRAASGLSERHAFTTAANPRNSDCVRCGRPKEHLVHRTNPELRRAVLVSHAEAGIARVREGDERSAELEFEVVLKILRETR